VQEVDHEAGAREQLAERGRERVRLARECPRTQLLDAAVRGVHLAPHDVDSASVVVAPDTRVELTARALGVIDGL